MLSTQIVRYARLQVSLPRRLCASKVSAASSLTSLRFSRPNERSFSTVYPKGYLNDGISKGVEAGGEEDTVDKIVKEKKEVKRTLPSFSLEGRVAVVTGGARGLGLTMSKALLSSGAEVAIVDLQIDKANMAVSDLINEIRQENPDMEPPKVSTHYADVSLPSSVSDAIASIIHSHHKIDILVTSAGFTENFPAHEYPHDRMQKLWGVNVDGTYNFATAIAKHLMERKSGGSLIFIGSMSGAIVNIPQPQAPYNAAKAAIRQLAASLAVEWAPKGIRVNCISPGYMLTALTREITAKNPDLTEKWISLIPQGRMGNPEDLMGAVTFLASDASSYVTGADLRVDGGYTVI